MKKNKIVLFSTEKDSQSRQKIIPKQANKSNNPLQVVNNNELPFGGMKFVYVQKPLDELACCTGVIIKQEPDLEEEKYGYERSNRYHVFGLCGQDYKYLFNCKERSGCCMRNCCPAESREFNMAVKHIATAANLDENFSAPYVNIRKPFKCTCCCLERPEMLVSYGNNQPLGRIKQPFTCCDPVFTTYDNTGVIRNTIHADCCQCGLLCKNNFCGKLSEVVFNVYAGSNMLTSPVGSIVKKVATAAELVTSADSYQVNFPPQATPTDKMLLIVAGLMIDYQFFEEAASSNDNSD